MIERTEGEHPYDEPAYVKKLSTAQAIRKVLDRWSDNLSEETIAVRGLFLKVRFEEKGILRVRDVRCEGNLWDALSEDVKKAIERRLLDE